MAKLGSAYEQIVGSVSRALEPGAEINVSSKKLGPDGRRDMDVSIRGTREGKPFFALIECKDWKRRVGIGVVDALESKRGDLKADMSTIYSNSGFTKDARKKASRVGISLCFALKAGDRRIRVAVEREFYARLLSVDQWSLTAFWRQDRIGTVELDPRLLLHNGAPVTNWISQKSRQLIAEYPDETYIQAEYAFRDEVPFDSQGQTVYLVGLIASLHCGITWVHQRIREDVTLGSFDLLKGTVNIPNGQAWSVGPFDNQAWKPVDPPPPDTPMEANSIRLGLTLLRPIASMANRPTPTLDQYVKEHAITFTPPAV